jgi:hypothetical protein
LWVEPVLVADGFERHPSFEGLIEADVHGTHPAFTNQIDDADMAHLLTEENGRFFSHTTEGMSQERATQQLADVN